MKKALVNKNYILEKFSGKGGWTYAEIPEILPDKHAHFGWVRVYGTIDGFEIKGYHLMPKGNGNLFLPIKAAIRKSINKKEGDFVHITLFEDKLPTEIPEELKICLLDVEGVYEKFIKTADSEKKTMIDWIYSSKTDETKAKRIISIIDKFSNL
jgi:hypothetical protein